MKRILGLFLIALPFVGIFVMGIAASGVAVTLISFAIAALVLLVTWAGVWLATS